MIAIISSVISAVSLGLFIFRMKPLNILPKLLITRPKEFIERDWIHPLYRHFTYRYSHAASFHYHPQQRTGCNDMIVGSILAEILQTIECFLTFLNLIKDNQGLACNYGNIRI